MLATGKYWWELYILKLLDNGVTNSNLIGQQTQHTCKQLFGGKYVL